MRRLAAITACLAIMAIWQMATDRALAETTRFLKIGIESTEIVAGDTLVVDIESTGLEEPVDLAPLDAIGERVRETGGTRIHVIGGKVVEVKLRRITLVPKGTGTVILGPLTSGETISNSVSFRIFDQADSAWEPGPGDIRVTARVSEPNPYVQAQTILDLEIRHRYPLADTTFLLPDLAGLRSRAVHTERRTLDATDDGWRVISWRYLLFPQQSGSITIEPLNVRGTIIKSRREKAPFDLQTEPVTLTVRPARTSGGQWWLPARSVSLEDVWSGNPRELSAGDEIERRIKVTAVDAGGVQIPDVVMAETRGLLITPLGVERATRMSESGVTGTATFAFRIRALSPIPVFADTIRLAWWDTLNDRPQEAVLPARRIDIGAPDRDALLQTIGAERGILGRISDAFSGNLSLGIAIVMTVAAFAVLAACALVAFGRGNLQATIRAFTRNTRLKRHLVSGDNRAALELIYSKDGSVELTGSGLEIRAALEANLFGKSKTGDLPAILAHRPAFIARPRQASVDALPSL